ncbi:MAG: glycosyltransferase family 2 protein, partial [Chromatiaceae bacterium]
MKATPPVSVIMSVYNGESSLTATLDSVLAQKGVVFEFIVVDDGSTDGGGAMLDDYARRDERVRVIHRENRGLTRALMRGCAAARGQYIARQDAGDLSLPGRLARQFAFLESNPEVVLTACGSRFVGPAGEPLYEVIQQGDELQRGLEQLDSKRVRGPSHHGSVMFRRATYQAVGGYRPEFRVAQDLDLWMRLAEVGGCVAVPEVLYQACWQAGSISHLRREQQVLATGAI